MNTSANVVALAGVAIPIYDPKGDVWGGCWFQVPAGAGPRELALDMLPWYLGNTLLLSVATVVLLSLKPTVGAFRWLLEPSLGVLYSPEVQRC